jgi:hypothetical protein
MPLVYVKGFPIWLPDTVCDPMSSIVISPYGP